MNKEKQGTFLIQGGNWIYKRLEQIEIFLAVIIAVVIALKNTTDLPMSYFTLVSMSSLAIVYFSASYGRQKESEYIFMVSFVNKLLLWSLSVSVIGMLFVMNHYPDGHNLLMVGSLTQSITLIISLVLRSKYPHQTIFNFRYFLRAVIILAISGFMWLNYSANDVVETEVIEAIG